MKNPKQPKRRGRKTRTQNSPSDLVELAHVSRTRESSITCRRAISIPLTLNPSLGWSSSGHFDLGLTFSASIVNSYLGGVVATANSIPGSGDIPGLFEWWRIDFVEIQFLLNGNDLVVNNANAVAALPVLNIAFDPNDSSTFSLSSILQYENLKTVQMGNMRNAEGYTIRFRPTVLPTVVYSGGTLSALTRPERQKPVDCSTDFLAAEHYGLKIFYDPGLFNTNGTVANINMYCHIQYTLSNTH